MSGTQFRQLLKREFEERKQRNARYSLRAFAAFLNTDHSTLSQIFRGKREFTTEQIRRWGKKIGMSREEVAAYVAAQHVLDPSIVKRQEQLRHWTAEALAIVTDRRHWQILQLSERRGFQGDCRWLAEQMDIGVDDVNVAMSRLLRLGLLEIGRAGKWKALLGSGRVTEKEFLQRALIRVRELAAEDGVELRERTIHSSH